MPPKPKPILENFFAHVEITPSCWLWHGALGAEGYGRFLVKENGRRHTRLSHRVAYQLFVGPIPAGTGCDHLCHTADKSCKGGPKCPHRRCVNPAHLEPVLHLENVARGAVVRRTHCPKGHAYDEKNAEVRVDNLGRRSRRCRACHSAEESARGRAQRRLTCKIGHQSFYR
jgi:hypothetical protein